MTTDEAIAELQKLPFNLKDKYGLEWHLALTWQAANEVEPIAGWHYGYFARGTSYILGSTTNLTEVVEKLTKTLRWLETDRGAVRTT
jgi:hypothetical protein